MFRALDGEAQFLFPKIVRDRSGNLGDVFIRIYNVYLDQVDGTPRAAPPPSDRSVVRLVHDCIACGDYSWNSGLLSLCQRMTFGLTVFRTGTTTRMPGLLMSSFGCFDEPGRSYNRDTEVWDWPSSWNDHEWCQGFNVGSGFHSFWVNGSDTGIGYDGSTNRFYANGLQYHTNNIAAQSVFFLADSAFNVTFSMAWGLAGFHPTRVQQIRPDTSLKRVTLAR